MCNVPYNIPYNDSGDLAPYIVSIIMASIAFYWIFFLLAYAVVAIPKWVLYEKAGKPGWAAIVPFYQDYVLFELTWGNGILFLLLMIPFANVVISIITWIKFAQAYGKGGGYACGLIFLRTIFLYIMAFSNDVVYVGVPGNGQGFGQTGYQNPYQQPPYGQPGYQNPYQRPPYSQPGYQNPYQPPYGQTGYQAPPQNSAPSETSFCPDCGNPLSSGASFCPKCGKRQ